MASPSNSGPARDASTAELVKELAHDTSTLVRQEIELARTEFVRTGEAVVKLARQELELAKAELAAKGRKAGPGLGMVGGAGVATLLALGALTAFAILALDGVMPNWLAALVVAIAWAAIGAVLYFTGKERVHDAGPLVPEQTVDTVKEDVEWAKTQIGSGRR